MSAPLAPLEIWGGVECTVNRVGDRFFDQLVWSGHDTRIDDLATFASLGIRALRYPVLWERVAPHSTDDFDWRWTDERLARLRALACDLPPASCTTEADPRIPRFSIPVFPRSWRSSPAQSLAGIRGSSTLRR